MLLLILGLILFIGLVVIHEFGHFIMAKRNGVEVEEFGIGFPPKVWSRKTKGGWLFSINLLPLGGFVRLKGEHDDAQAKGSFGAASLSAKTKIMAAGVVMNLATALVMLTALSWVGSPVLVCNQFTVESDTHYLAAGANAVTVESVEAGSPASRAGLQKGDEIVAAGPSSAGLEKVTPECSLGDITKENAGGPLTIQYKRDGQTRIARTTLLSEREVAASQNTKDPKGYLGVVSSTGLRFARSTWSAPVVAIGQTAQFTQLTFQGLGKALAGLGSLIAGGVTGNSEARSNGQKEASSQVSGPLGIFFVLKEGSGLGLRFVLFIIAIISLTLAIMNILPIPALDGGRLWLTLIAHAINKPLTKEREELINGIGFLVLMALIVLITIVDVKRFF
jgi:regulator of sigma E protease